MEAVTDNSSTSIIDNSDNSQILAGGWKKYGYYMNVFMEFSLKRNKVLVNKTAMGGGVEEEAISICR